MLDRLTITMAKDFVFRAKLLLDRAPDTCAAFTALLPYRQRLIHARWSGEAWYPGGISETELLFVYGSSRFASKAGPLAGNPFLAIVEGGERLEEMGRHVLYRGAQDIVFESTPSAIGRSVGI